MAATDTVTPVVLSDVDVADARALSEEAGWNQVADDWRLMLRTGSGFGLRNASGALVGSALALPYAQVGWISMVLVTRGERRRGHATRLVEAACAALEEAALLPVLDATPAGEAVYARMGFVRQRSMRRWRRENGVLDGAPFAAQAVRPAEISDLPWISDLDAKALDSGRDAILSDLLGRPTALALVSEARDGALLGRSGAQALQIGPLIAESEAIALRLLATALDGVHGPIIIDAFDDHPAVADLLAGAGFTVERGFARMTRGTTVMPGDSGLSFAAAGPELG